MELTPKMFRAIDLIYDGMTKQAVAAELKISIGTLNRWTNDPDFKAATVALAAQRIGQLVPEAVQTIQQVMSDPCSKSSDRLAAAKTVLEYAKITEREEQDKTITVRVEYV